MNAIVKKKFSLCYGFSNKAWITLNRGQKWKVYEPKPKHPYYTIIRKRVQLDVFPYGFEEFFEVQDG